MLNFLSIVFFFYSINQAATIAINFATIYVTIYKLQVLLRAPETMAYMLNYLSSMDILFLPFVVFHFH